jgi:hypothetical protein
MGLRHASVHAMTALSRTARAALIRCFELLAPNEPGLADQVQHVEAVAVTPTFLDLTVPLDVPAADVPDGPLPGRALVVDEDGETTGELLVWLSSGRLSGLELAWYGDETPSDWPAPDRIVAG